MAVSRGPRGERTVVTGHPGARVVSYGPRRGFVERSVRPGFISRTYVGHGRPYVHVYREFRYRGFVYYCYVPAVYYGPRFYGWVLTPWSVPVRYAWFGISPAPWFGFYAGYFTPYPMYSSPYLWLTDYLLTENLRLAYESQGARNAGHAPTSPVVAPNEATLSPAIKALIADEVKHQLAAEQTAAAQTARSNSNEAATGGEQLPPALTQRFFVVSSNLDVVAAGQACSLTPGDIIQRKGKAVLPDGTIAVEIVSSKPGNCEADSTVKLAVTDLQEMHNQFREQLDSGLKTLADNEAKGLPKPPAVDARVVAEGIASPVADAEAELAAQESEAAILETQVQQGSSN